jgi:signal transduction histidine kinase
LAFASLQYQLDFLQKTGAYETSLKVSEENYPLAPETEILLFRVAQELLNNIVKHAYASRISVILDYQQGQLVLEIIDNGKGFDVANVEDKTNAKGLGLSNMKKRLAPLQAAFRVDSEPGNGTRVAISVPKNQKIS